MRITECDRHFLGKSAEHSSLCGECGGNSKDDQFVFDTLQMTGCLHIYSCPSMHQEDKHMTRTDLQINQEAMWRKVVFEQRTTLTLGVEMLLRCHLSPEQILTKTAMALEGSHHDS
jgi:hypothetical protein